MLAATIITAFIGSSIVAAAPADVSARQLTICSGTYSNAQCCATDVLGLADLNCANPPTTPTSQEDFIDICATEGQQARCCALPIVSRMRQLQDHQAYCRRRQERDVHRLHPYLRLL
ncbi:hypothetical protein D6C83_04389 [Aureobasidium pullulans]|uniref:Hydrophobin n=1 Tax=Aureobasidium pullulans TaxID=5580 RepID=A0A4T0CY79_AURPU|nr:hypothetical protein D6C83_04389 [Aureobasidium pullulans]